MRKMTALLERFLLASRWLLAPLFLGLLVALVALLVKAGQHVIHIAETILTATESDVILSALGLVDLTLAASLILIIIFSGYENFLTTLDGGGRGHFPTWLTRIDFTGMKLKLLASIVSIAAVQLLRVFMSVTERSDREVFWSATLLVVFVLAAVLLALADKIDGGHADDGTGGH
jgi:uncharacterized protein (TIGR00645 family)